jgi:hypothetical protein
MIEYIKNKAHSILRHDPSDLSNSEYRRLKSSARDLLDDIEYYENTEWDTLPEEIEEIKTELERII